ncbi:Rpn family recombination-promoting nuclease/putative transposase [Butyrivibrio sp. VCD2006]|uniref:Rpn family recombination-promoting nuclease/putative transposase n=1 Tax=Butyrivibrio sp. VCD2006 TaxID=1280664 RepID=UPI0004786C22|nr:Rpn family recombination-promoting nuclease/putative transposase [Butyrivibrio sp. VCD2006]
MSNEKITYKDATGTIEYTLKSDLMFHYVMQKSKTALLGLVCALKGIDPSSVRDIIVMNPIELNNSAKETVMDLKLILNNNEILNIELQVYTDKYWIKRSLLYLCRAYDSIGMGDDYSKLKPTTHICITDQNLFPDDQEFYREYLLLNTRNHHLYTKNFGIKVLQLNHIRNATQKDIDNNLVYWAKLFEADTWEKFQYLAQNNPAIEEVGNLILELNTDNQAKEILEGQRRYREMLASQYTAGYTDAEEKMASTIAEKDNAIAEKDAALAEKDALLKKYIDKFGNL